MTTPIRASIIISSYNYARFLTQAIDSALRQTYPHTEVIVVDDGSTDNSREIIATYRDAITPMFKRNGGQASSLNAGFALSNGEVILFLDSDDVLLPSAMETAVDFFRNPSTAKVHWPLWEVDDSGKLTGKKVPDWCSPGDLAEGNVRDAVLAAGPDAYERPPTSGNVWARRVLERILPMPEPEYKTCPDFYLATLAPLFGQIRRVLEPQSCWRNHGRNQTWADPLNERLSATRRRHDRCLVELQQHCAAMGLPFDLASCRANSWTEWRFRTQQAIQEIEGLVPPDDCFILVNGDKWCEPERPVANRRSIPFLEKEGTYWGPPPDDETGIREVERLRRQGARFIVFAWPAFWWLDYYSGLHRHLRSMFRCVLENERLVIFDLRTPD